MTALNTLSDNDLLALHIEGNRKAFDEIYSRHWERLYAFIIKAVRDEDEAQDLVQEVFISFWIKRNELGHIYSLTAWLFGAARNKALLSLRTSRNRQIYLDALADYMTEVTDSLSEQQAEKELQILIDREIDNLPPKMKEVFVLSRRENLSYREIAEKLEISDKTVKKQINNVLNRFRIKLDDSTAGLISIIILQHFRK